MTAKIKLNAASGGGSISIQAPSSSSNNRVINLPDIADGTLVTSQSTLDATKLSGALPAISGAALTGLSSGLAMADQWGINNSHQFSSTVEDFTANWNRNPCSTYTKIGTGMTESSGVFTFPSTGIYLVMASFRFMSISTTLRYLGFNIQTTTDNFSSTVSADTAYSSIGISTNFGAYAQITNNIMFDVTNTSTHKVKFRGRTETAAGTYLSGTSDGMGSGATFLRLGDT